MKEKLANLCHSQWSGWMEYLWSKSRHMNIEIDGTVQRCVVIPNNLVIRWERQMKTPYTELPDNEQDSDRKEADKFLSIINHAS